MENLVSSIVLRDEFSKAFSSYDKQLTQTEQSQGRLNAAMQSTGTTLKNVGVALASAGIFAALIREADEAIDKAKIQAQADAQLGAVLESTGHAAGLTSSELTRMASELQSVTNYGDEATIKGQALLATFTRIGRDVFPRATATMLDMSAALDQDLKSSALQLGKALNNPIAGISALQEVGVLFTAQQKEQIRAMDEAGNIVGAQTIILDELQREFGGAAAAARDADADFQAAANAVGDLQEVIGEKLIPATREYNRLVIASSEGFTSAISDAGILAGVYKELADQAGLLPENFNATETALDALSIMLFGQSRDALERNLTTVGNWLVQQTEAAVGTENFIKAIEATLGPIEAAEQAERDAANAGHQLSIALDRVAASIGSMPPLDAAFAEFEADRLGVIEKIADQREKLEADHNRRMIGLQGELADASRQAAEEATAARVEANQSLARDIAGIESDLASDRLAAVQDFNEAAAKLAGDRTKIEADAARDIGNVNRKLGQDLANLQRDTKQAVSDINRDLANELDDLAYKSGQDRLKIEKGFQDDFLKVEQDFARRRQQVNDQFESEFATADPFRRKILEFNRAESLKQLGEQEKDEKAALQSQSDTALVELQSRVDHERDILERDSADKKARLEREARDRADALKTEAAERQAAIQQQLAEQLTANAQRQAEIERDLALEQVKLQQNAEQAVAKLQERNVQELAKIDEQAAAKVARAEEALAREKAAFDDRAAALEENKQRELQTLEDKYREAERLETSFFERSLRATQSYASRRQAILNSSGGGGGGLGEVGIGNTSAGGGRVTNNSITVVQNGGAGGYAGGVQTGRTVQQALKGFA